MNNISMIDRQANRQAAAVGAVTYSQPEIKKAKELCVERFVLNLQRNKRNGIYERSLNPTYEAWQQARCASCPEKCGAV